MLQQSLFATSVAVETKTYRVLKETDADYTTVLSTLFDVDRIFLDLETFDPAQPRKGKKSKVGLDSIEGRIRFLQMLPADGDQVIIIDFGDREIHDYQKHSEVIKRLGAWLAESNNVVVGHNLLFDLRFLRHQLSLVTECYVTCTLVGAKTYYGDFGSATLDKGQSVLPGGYGLGNLAEKLLGVKVDKTDQRSDFGAPSTQSQLDYAASDVLTTRDIFTTLRTFYLGDTSHKYAKEFLYHASLIKLWQLENEVLKHTIDVETVGLPCDLEFLQQQIEKVQQTKHQLESDWVALNARLKPAKSEGLFELDGEPVSYTSNKPLLAWLKQEGIVPHQAKATGKDALSKYVADQPVVRLLFQLRAVTALENNLKSFQLSSARDGRIHTRYRTQTGVGRFSSGDTTVSKAYPNLQSISSKSNQLLASFRLDSVRKIVTASEGRVLAVVDLSGAHARIAAGLANDPLAIEMQNDDSIDGHSKVAAFIAAAQGLDWDDQHIASAKADKSHPDSAKAKMFRDTAKSTFYGWLNGAGAERIRDQIGADTGKAPSLELCEAAREGCNKLYPNIPVYTRNMRHNLTREIFRLGGKQFCAHRPEGLGHLTIELYLKDDNWETPYTKTIGYTWQYVEAVAVKQGFVASARLAKQHPEWGLNIINVVHDELDIECNEDYAQEAITAVNNAFNGAFLEHLANGVLDGRATDWQDLVAGSWADK